MLAAIVGCSRKQLSLTGVRFSFFRLLPQSSLSLLSAFVWPYFSLVLSIFSLSLPLSRSLARSLALSLSLSLFLVLSLSLSVSCSLALSLAGVCCVTDDWLMIYSCFTYWCFTDAFFFCVVLLMLYSCFVDALLMRSWCCTVAFPLSFSLSLAFLCANALLMLYWWFTNALLILYWCFTTALLCFTDALLRRWSW